VEKDYGIDSEIKYRDEDGEIEFSDNIIVEVPLKSRDAGISITTLAIAGIFLIVAYMGYNTMRRKNDKK
jgi:hypothetical protein